MQQQHLRTVGLAPKRLHDVSRDSSVAGGGASVSQTP